MVKTLSTERNHQIGNASDPRSQRCWLGLQHSVKDWVPFHFPSLICDFRQNEANLLLFPEPRAIFTWREDAHLWPNRQIWTLDWMLKCPPVLEAGTQPDDFLEAAWNIILFPWSELIRSQAFGKDLGIAGGVASQLLENNGISCSPQSTLPFLSIAVKVGGGHIRNRVLGRKEKIRQISGQRWITVSPAMKKSTAEASVAKGGTAPESSYGEL